MQRTTLNVLLYCALMVGALAACDSGGDRAAEGFELPAAPGSDLPRATDGGEQPGTTGPDFGQDGDEASSSGSNSGPPGGGPGAIGEGGNGTPSGGAEAGPGLSCLELYDAVAVCYDTYYGCASACQDQGCSDACETTYWGCYDGTVEQGSQVGQDQLSLLRVCEETHYQDCYDKGEVF
jgi:hypothetical protein